MSNSLQNYKILDWSKLKTFAGNKINVTQKFILFYWKVENVGKGENAGYQLFFFFPHYVYKRVLLKSR